ncbi:MAG: alpha/beta hydrolase [Steroidobacteraceae bacterium]
MRRVALIVVEVLLAGAALVAGLIAFGTRPAPPLSPAAVAAFKGVDFTTLPPLEHYSARDGAQLGYRRYGLPAGAVATRVIVLLHGASDSGPTMHPLAESLRAAGLVVYVPELRGHGDSEPSGDIRYVGQLEDDLVDFAAMLRRREGSAPLRLVGFSAGGGLALRFAGGAHAQLFSGYLLLSPGLAYQGPMVRPAGGAASSVRNFAVPYVPRLIGLSIADAIGVHAFDGLPVVAFAVPAHSKTFARTYSLRMASGLTPADYRQAIAAVKVPTTVIIGDADEFSIASEVARAFHASHPEIPVIILPGARHLDLVTQPAALAAIRQWATQ